MKKRTIAVTLLSAMMLGACADKGPVLESPTQREVSIPFNHSEASQELTKNVSTLSAPGSEINNEQISALSIAGTKLFANTAAAAGADQNVCISPVSVELAFGMAESGAGGNTLSQIESVVGGGIAIDEMSPLLYDLSTRMKNAPDVDWNVANSIWLKDEGIYELIPEFASKASSWYDAQVWKAPFNDTTLNDINGWVDHETRGMIPNILDKISDEARMYIINALAFEAEWLNEYEDRQIYDDMDFTNADGSISKVTMLHSGESRYFELNGGTGFLRDYKGGQYSFMGLLPGEGVDLDDYIKDLADSNADISEAIRNTKGGNVVVEIPEFTFDYDIEMSAILQSMGMTDAFDPELADFNNMLCEQNGDPHPVCISSVIHKTHIEVDRKGTRAAAATAIEMTDGCTSVAEPIEYIFVILDRPFIYGIIDNETGLPVFLGCVNQM